MTTSAPRKQKKDFDPNKGYEELANSLIEIMEKGVNPFRRSWTAEQQHTNFVTGDAYQNGNLICLEIARICKGFTSPYWMGFSQARKFGLRIKKGSKGSIILRPVAIKKELLDTNGKPVKDALGNTEFTAFTLFTPCRVFNLDCFEKSPKLEARLAELNKEVVVNQSPVSAKEAKAIKQLMQYMDSQKIVFSECGNSAFYNPDLDSITVPNQNRFTSNSLFVAVTSHECGHSTGSKKRLNRKGITDKTAVFGSDLYATEELIADTCSWLCCNEFQIDSNDDVHASYLVGWIKVLKKEPKHLLTVIGQAVKAKNLIMGS
jgi:antirestriction protein ArdC